MARIYISSTYSDLEECREAVYHALRSTDHDVVAMEHYVATDQRPLDKCLADVASCDLYVGILAWRYGYVPPKDNPEQKSITELEFRHAVANDIPCLLFLLDESAPWPYERIEQGAGQDKLKLLRAEVADSRIVSFFHNRDQLAAIVSNAVNRWSASKTAPADGDRPKSAAARVSLSRLPVTGRDLFGRDEQLARLDEAWAGRDTHVLSLVAWGGIGKSALVNHWLGQMALDDYRGAARIYGWSFYSQGTTDRAVSADQFIEAALVFFGDKEPNKGSPWDKGERLAGLVGAQRTLLVLDGLEPLQHPPGPDEGRLKDQALQALLRQLAAHNEGLCVISTRVAVTDLSPFEGSTATRIDLEHLSPQAGAQVLRAQGVKGTEDELQQASEDFGGHSLALTLLGSYLSDVYGGDVRRRAEVSNLAGDVRFGGHARRVMASYEKWFGEGPELAVLRMLGLFNRPADKEAVSALRARPLIPGLTDKLFRLKPGGWLPSLFSPKEYEPMSESAWNQTLIKLRHAKLLAAQKPDQPGTLDTHPLVREHFGEQLKTYHPDAWREGHNRLFEHLKNATKEFPETVDEMAPLYAAVAHGCAAGRHQEALDEVYIRRIRRGNDIFSFHMLGAFGADLAALANFFELPWLQLVSTLSENRKPFILADTGYALQSLGRLAEATQPMQASLDARILHEEWTNAARVASNLSELYLISGDLAQSLDYARKSVDFADRSGVSFLRMNSMATLADILYRTGNLSDSQEAIFKAEEIQKDLQPYYPLLYSLAGFRYCALLLHQGKYQEVQARASQTLAWVTKQGWHLDTALDNLSLGRAYLLQSLYEDTDNNLRAAEHIDRAAYGIRQSGYLDYLPHSLLARAELQRVRGEFDHALANLHEVLSITLRGGMKLYQADCHLEYTRLYLAQGEKERAWEHWSKAKEIIERIGYHLRDAEVQEIGRELEGKADG